MTLTQLLAHMLLTIYEALSQVGTELAQPAQLPLTEEHSVHVINYYY